MNSNELVTLISSIACIIAKNRTNEELNLLSTFFSQLGDTLATISATKSLCNSHEEESSS